jgi:hypothetical protein
MAKKSGRKVVTKDMRAQTKPSGAISPIEYPETNTENLAVAGLKRDLKRRVRPEHSPGGPGTFSPNGNSKFL